MNTDKQVIHQEKQALPVAIFCRGKKNLEPAIMEFENNIFECKFLGTLLFHFAIREKRKNLIILHFIRTNGLTASFTKQKFKQLQERGIIV